MTTPREQVHRLYRRVHGWTITDSEKQRVLATRSSPTYGEILPSAAQRLFESLELGPRDVLYDFGSGIGKVVVQAAMTMAIRRIVGVELVAGRHAIAQSVLERARTRGLLHTRRVDLRCENFLRTDASDATVVYTCSTAFSDAFMRTVARRLARLRPGLLVVTTQEIDSPGRFAPVDVLELDMSWRRKARVHVYRLLPARRPLAGPARSA